MTAITAAITAGLSARWIYQDLVSEQGFTGSYQSVSPSALRANAQLSTFNV